MAVRSLQLVLAVVSLFCFATKITGDNLHQFPLSRMPPPMSNTDLDGSLTTLLEPILAHLGFQQLSTAADGIKDLSTAVHWNGPFTVFAPSDAAIESCSSCSRAQILGEHTIPGLFSASDLLDLAPDSRIETMNPGHCIAVTSRSNVWENRSSILISGVKITQPDLFNNGLLIVHGLSGSVSPLSQSSCSPPAGSPPPQKVQSYGASMKHRLIMEAMLQDAIIRLRNHGYGVLALAMKVKYHQLMVLDNATIFAVEDNLIFSEVRNYAGNIRFHIVPNMYIEEAELFRLPLGAKLETMDRDQYLLVTGSGSPSNLQINFVGIKMPEVVKNLKVVVHTLFLPFPRILMGPPSPDDSLVVSDASDLPESLRKTAIVPVSPPQRSIQTAVAVPLSTQTAPPTAALTPPPTAALTPVPVTQSVADEGDDYQEGPITIEDSHGL